MLTIYETQWEPSAIIEAIEAGQGLDAIKALLTDVEGALFTNVRKGMKLGMLEVLGSINRPFLAGEAGPHAQHGVPAMRQFIAFLKMKGI